jgi:hypothetical protein
LERKGRDHDTDHAAVDRDSAAGRTRLQVVLVDRREHRGGPLFATRINLGRCREEAQAITHLDLVGHLDFQV